MEGENAASGLFELADVPLEPGDPPLLFFDRMERSFQSRHPAVERGTLPLELGPAVGDLLLATRIGRTLGMTLLALLPLVLCWYLLQGLGRTDEEQIGEILIEDIISEEPQLLPAPPATSPSRVLEYRPELAEQDGADESTLPG